MPCARSTQPWRSRRVVAVRLRAGRGPDRLRQGTAGGTRRGLSPYPLQGQRAPTSRSQRCGRGVCAERGSVCRSRPTSPPRGVGCGADLAAGGVADPRPIRVTQIVLYAVLRTARVRRVVAEVRSAGSISGVTRSPWRGHRTWIRPGPRSPHSSVESVRALLPSQKVLRPTRAFRPPPHHRASALASRGHHTTVPPSCHAQPTSRLPHSLQITINATGRAVRQSDTSAINDALSAIATLSSSSTRRYSTLTGGPPD
jgi:hypothetical protein